VITGPTSGIGYFAALELIDRGTVVLVGRNTAKLAELQSQLQTRGGNAVCVVADFSDVASARRAAAEIIALRLPIAGVLNNAGMMSQKDGATTHEGWDLTYATNHLGPFAFTEALIPHLADGTEVLFTVSAVEDPERKPAVASGFRGGRYISAAASLRGQWNPGGSSNAGFDAYATSKQSNLATVFSFASEFPHLRFSAVEPGFSPGSNLGRDASPFLQFVAQRILSPLAPMIKYWSTPKIAGRLLARLLTDPATINGTYYDENGKPMRGSAQVRDPSFFNRVVAETRTLLDDTMRTHNQE
jgi:NAD(P)-dependent dehydrogenase (short-subunit alcohol dehydrogenase family)